MIVVIGIISIVGSISLVTYNTLRYVGDARHAAYVFVDALKEAQNKAKIMEYDTAWGVKVNTADAVVFSGASYSGRETSRDKVYIIPKDLIISGPTEIVFAKFTGLPNTSGTTTFSNAF